MYHYWGAKPCKYIKRNSAHKKYTLIAKQAKISSVRDLMQVDLGESASEYAV